MKIETIEIDICELAKKEISKQDVKKLVKHIKTLLNDSSENLLKIECNMYGELFCTTVHTKTDLNNPKGCIYDEFQFFVFEIREVDFSEKKLQRFSQRHIVAIKDFLTFD